MCVSETESQCERMGLQAECDPPVMSTVEKV